MTEKRYSRMTNHYGTSRTYCTGIYDKKNNRELTNSSQVITELNNLHEENQSLKEQLLEAKLDEKQLGISFMEFKMKLIDVLQRNYEYAENQRQKNLDNTIVAHLYNVLIGTVKGIADDLGVDLE